MRGDEAIVPRGNTEILDGDHIVLFALPESVSKLLKYLTLVWRDYAHSNCHVLSGAAIIYIWDFYIDTLYI